MSKLALPYWSLQAGNTAASRALLRNRTAPATSQEHDVGQSQQLDLVIHETAGGTAVAQVEYRYGAADIWVLDTSLGTSGNITVAANAHMRVKIDPSAADKVRVKLGTFAAGATVSCWIQGRYPKVR
jgi:hypothetical protein